jgi:hypothetical protein
LNIDDDLGFTQLLGQALVFPTEFLHLFLLRIASGLGAALMRGQTLEHAGLPLAPPCDQVRRVQPLAPKQGADAAGLSGRGIGLCQDALFVFSRKRPALGVGDHLRIGARLGRPLGRDGFALPSTTGVLASLGLPTFRGGQNRRGSRRDSIDLQR